MRDILRLAAAAPALKLANVGYNLEQIKQTVKTARERGVKILALPELCLTGATCGDLFFQPALQERVVDAIEQLCACPEIDGSMLVAVGAPLCINGVLYDCAVLLGNHRVQAVVPKTYLSNHHETYEKRHFTSGLDLLETWSVMFDGEYVSGGTDLIVETEDGVRIGIELGSDLYSPLPPSTTLALGGADIILNLAADHELVGKRTYRRDLVCGQSARTVSAYVYANAGAGESTSDLLYGGHCMIAANGRLLAETPEYISDSTFVCADIDLANLRADRVSNNLFRDTAAAWGANEKCRPTPAVDIRLLDEDAPCDLMHVDKLPFIPSTQAERIVRCRSIFELQANALARRLSTIRAKAVIGISGGLDSTLALLVSVRAMEILGRPRTDVIGVTMPCFGTTDHTFNNSLRLMEGLGIDSRTVPIAKSVLQHFEDIGHDPNDYSVTYENAQARERTQVLMDIGNREGGIVVGTGDLSELALGWCTYNADHMSMYGVNAGVPKTLVRWVITAVADEKVFPEVTDVLRSIIDTPISPELLPPDATGKIAQITEDLVGPYALHDFFLYYMIRYATPPRKLYELARLAFAGDFDDATVKKWLITFYRRFFTQQFKRNCQPDGVKVGTVALSPRGDWRMPTDADFRLWVEEAEQL